MNGPTTGLIQDQLAPFSDQLSDQAETTLLKELRIKNFVLIESLDLAFGPGICLLTGETGAGKSIVIDAIEAAMGGRVSLDLIRAGANKATIEATFVLTKSHAELMALLESEGIECEIQDEITLSRELSPKGARCRIEGQQVTQAVLRQAGELLVDVLSQHEHQALMEPSFHLILLDTFGDLDALVGEVSRMHASWSGLVAERNHLVAGRQAREQQRDFWAYQLQEIQAAELKDPAEDEALKAERLRLANVEALRLASAGAYEALYAGENGPSLHDQLNRVISALQRQAHLDSALSAAAEQLVDAQAILRDVAGEMRDHGDRLDADPSRLAEVEDRLDLLNSLARKYGPGLDAVIAHAGTLEKSLAEVDNLDSRLEELDAAVLLAQSKLGKAADALTAARAKAAKQLETAVESQLKELELPNSRFVVALIPYKGENAVRAFGQETIEFQIAMNPGEPPKALAKTASGGEMARVMLSLKTVLAGLGAVPTLIFDEVDTGISGKAAQAVAEKLAGLGRHYQVLCITHLPTVAAMADQHLHLEKHVEDGRTHVVVQNLDAPARVKELARIASGDHSPAAVRHAEDLLKRAKGFKSGLAKTIPAKPRAVEAVS